MEGRLGRVLGRDSGIAGVGSHEAYPPRLLIVVRERCSAGGVRDDGLDVGKSSGCGCAGSFELLWFFVGLGKSLGVAVAGVSPGLMGPLCAWYQSRTVAILRFATLALRQGRRWGVDLSSWAKRGRVSELDRP